MMRRMQEISFEATEEERALIEQIVARADAMLDGVDRVELDMDLTAVNANGLPLDFERLLNFPEFDFLHDLSGIRRHLNRVTGRLEGFFVPRCAKPKPVEK